MTSRMADVSMLRRPRTVLGRAGARGKAVTVVETRVSVWEALAGRAPGTPVAPADPGLWAAVAERLNPARAKPRLRTGIEESHLVSVRGVRYVMLRSPDGTPCYLRLSPEELALARLMDGTRTVARLVAEFARITGKLAPDQVTRVVADLAANRMLEELPVDAFHRLKRIQRRPWPARLGRGRRAAAPGRRRRGRGFPLLLRPPVGVGAPHGGVEGRAPRAAAHPRRGAGAGARAGRRRATRRPGVPAARAMDVQAVLRVVPQRRGQPQ